MDPVTCKIIKCGVLVESLGRTAADLAAATPEIGGEGAYTDETAAAMIEALEQSAALIEGAMPAPAATD